MRSPAKQNHPRASTELGMQIARSEQKKKHVSSIFSNREPGSKVTLSITFGWDRLLAKHPLPMLSTVQGMHIDFNEE
jgi:hypothetical protein